MPSHKEPRLSDEEVCQLLDSGCFITGDQLGELYDWSREWERVNQAKWSKVDCRIRNKDRQEYT